MGTYVWGSGDLFQLGTGEQNDLFSPVELGTGERPFTLASCGLGHTVALNTDGEVYAWGLNENGQCGVGGRRENVEVPALLDSLSTKRVSWVSCGESHTVALTTEGVALTWGSSEVGQCGQGAVDIFTTPKVIKSLRLHFCVRAACGSFHTAIVTNDGTVFTMGRGKTGALGLGTTEDVLYPKEITALSNEAVVQVACGDSHTVLLTTSRRLFSCGRNRHGQLGLSSRDVVATPEEIKAIDAPLMIACGLDHTLVVSEAEDGGTRLWAFGAGRAGQLGFGGVVDMSDPQEVILEEGVSRNIVKLRVG